MTVENHSSCPAGRFQYGLSIPRHRPERIHDFEKSTFRRGFSVAIFHKQGFNCCVRLSSFTSPIDAFLSLSSISRILRNFLFSLLRSRPWTIFFDRPVFGGWALH